MKKFVSIFFSLVFLLFFLAPVVKAIPELDKTIYHTWDEVNDYLDAVAGDSELQDIVELISIGMSREGRPLRVLRISREGIAGMAPDVKPAAFIMGAHHAREHISKEAVLGLIDKLINGYGKPGAEGSAITYLVNAGTFYLLPWVNPDGGTNEFFHNPEQRKTNYVVDEPQIGAADCETCGDGDDDEDSPDIISGDVGIISGSGFTIAFADNGIINRSMQLWYEGESYDNPVLDVRVGRIQPGGSVYTFNYEGMDPDVDGLYYPYSGEDSIGGTDPNRNYGEPLWGDCSDDNGCSWLSGAQTYAGPAPFSEPETDAVAGFLRSHPNIGTLESLHSGVNEIYPPWFVYPDPQDNSTMDEAYQDAVAQYISQATGYEVVYGGQYSVKGDTTGYSYIGANQNPEFDLDFFPGGVLSFITEIYGMGSDSGSAEAVRDWFPNHWQQFDTNYPQGVFIAWSDFPWCTTCNPNLMPGPLGVFNYVQYMEYFIFNSEEYCGGEDAPGVFHCDYWGIGNSSDYYADFDIFAYFNPPAGNRHYEDWNSNGKAIVRTVDRQLKHLMYRLYIAPFIRIGDIKLSEDMKSLKVSVVNEGFLRSSIMTTSLKDKDSFLERDYTYGLINVQIEPEGFTIEGDNPVNIGWLGGRHPDDPEEPMKYADFSVSDLNFGDKFKVIAHSDKTGPVQAMFEVNEVANGKIQFNVLSTNFVKRPKNAEAYFLGKGPDFVQGIHTKTRSINQIHADMARAEKNRNKWKRIMGPFDVLPGYTKGIKVRKYH